MKATERDRVGTSLPDAAYGQQAGTTWPCAADVSANKQATGETMPLINVKVIEGVFSDAQKAAMVEKLTDVLVGIEGEHMRPVTWVIIEEVKSGDWGVGGKPVTA